MKKNLLVLLSFVCAMQLVSLKANAQAQDWFIRIGASDNYYWGDDDGTARFKDRLSPSVNVTVGKWFNPYWAVQVGVNYGQIHGAGLKVDFSNPKVNKDMFPDYSADGLSPYTTGEQIENTYGETGEGSYKEKFNFFTIQPEIVYNVSNGMCGYNAKRVWNVLAHVGPSFGHSWKNGYNANSFMVTCGLTSTWMIDRNIQLWASGRLSLFSNGFDKVTYRETVDGMGTISAGISVNF